MYNTLVPRVCPNPLSKLPLRAVCTSDGRRRKVVLVSSALELRSSVTSCQNWVSLQRDLVGLVGKRVESKSKRADTKLLIWVISLVHNHSLSLSFFLLKRYFYPLVFLLWGGGERSRHGKAIMSW